MQIDAQSKRIDELKEAYYVVPDYQREYVWEADKHVEQFLTDLMDAYDPNSNQQESYFLGSIILVGDGKQFDVVDGQQRLTTIVITLCALRDIIEIYASELDATQQHHLSNIKSWLFSFDSHTEEERERLVLQYADSRDYLKQLISGSNYQGEETSSIKKMGSAYARIQDYFKIYSELNGVSALIQFVRFFLNSIELVEIKSKNLSSALKIFETINQRGVGLNAMDLVKNLLFAEAKEQEFVLIKDTWQKMASELESSPDADNPLRFLRYFLISRYHNGILREDEIYDWIISKEGKQTLGYEKNPVALARELHQVAIRYKELTIATESFSASNNFPHVAQIGLLNKYRSRLHLILLLALPESAQNETLDYLAEQIESYLFFSIGAGVQGKTNEQLFTRWAIELRAVNTKEGIDDIVAEHLVPTLQKSLSEFKNRFSRLPHTAYNPLYRQRYLLGRIDNRLRERAGLTPNSQQFIQSMQIEHVLPQTPRNNTLPKEFSGREEYDETVRRLGNVILLESMINQAVNNCNDLTADWFAQKQTEYARSQITLANLLDDNYSVGKNTAINRLRNKAGYNFTKWGLEEVEQHQLLLMDLAFDTWRLSGERLA